MPPKKPALILKSKTVARPCKSQVAMTTYEACCECGFVLAHDVNILVDNQMKYPAAEGEESTPCATLNLAFVSECEPEPRELDAIIQAAVDTLRQYQAGIALGLCKLSRKKSVPHLDEAPDHVRKAFDDTYNVTLHS